MYLIRLDDASEYMNFKNWLKIENLLDKYHIKPIFGIIPKNEDPQLLEYGMVSDFWNHVALWINKGWIPALHGYAHIFETAEGGINPVNNKSEYAGISLDKQRKKIRNGCDILHKHGIWPEIFFAPAHTFDLNTLEALKVESNIRIISDTIANDIYFENEFYFIPQQAGHVRRLPFKVVTFCYHPNVMTESDFVTLEHFLKDNLSKFGKFENSILKNRKRDLKDTILNKLYYLRHF